MGSPSWRGLHKAVFDSIWPARCALCEMLLEDAREAVLGAAGQDLLHRRCLQALPLCANSQCGPRSLREGAPLWAAFADEPRFFRLLHASKYGGRPLLLVPLAQRLAELAMQSGWLSGGAIVVPLPDDARRRRERGFSPTEIVAREIARHGQLTMRQDLLRRRSGGVSQARLSAAAARRDNQEERWVSGRIDAVASEVPLLLIDDQITTGATAASALQRLGARGNPVACIALAIAAAAPRVVVA